MVIDIKTASFAVSDGRAKVMVAFKTDRGVQHHLFDFPLKDNPEIDALVPIIEDSVRVTLAKNLGIITALVKAGAA